jgi:hypothetical protein
LKTFPFDLSPTENSLFLPFPPSFEPFPGKFSVRTDTEC